MPENQNPAPLFRLASNVILRTLRKAVIKIDAEFEKDDIQDQEKEKADQLVRSHSSKASRKNKRALKSSSVEKSDNNNLKSLKSSKKSSKGDPSSRDPDPEMSPSPLPLPLQLENPLKTDETPNADADDTDVRNTRSSGSGIFRFGSAMGTSLSLLLPSSGSDISESASMKVALSIMKIKNYFRNHLTTEVQLTLLQQSLTYSVISSTIPIIRFLILKDVLQLDFRGSNFWITKNFEPSSSPIPVSHQHPSINLDEKSRFKEHLSMLNPPNEFDWYAADRLGRPVSMNDALELFSIIRSAQCGLELKSLMINGRRGKYFTCHKDSMPIIEDTCSELRSLTKLVLRGMADDNMLSIIGKTVTSLKIFDVSCSKFVTDEGIRNVFYENVVPTPILYTISSYVQNSVKTMNPIVRTLELFDFSYTSVTKEAIDFVGLLPHAFIFQRLMVPSVETAFGHVLFIRHPVVLSTQIQLNDPPFHKALSAQVGTEAQAQFCKCANKLFWKKSFLTLINIEEPAIIPDYKSRAEKKQNLTILIGLITSSEEDKLVQGLVKFHNGNLKFFYNISPISFRAVAETLPNLESIQSILTGIYTPNPNNCSTIIFLRLTTINVFAEPSTISSILENCPNLVKVQFRVVWSPIKDEDIISSIEKSTSRFTLEEFWIAPGSYQKIKEDSPPPAPSPPPSKPRSRSRSRSRPRSKSKPQLQSNLANKENMANETNTAETSSGFSKGTTIVPAPGPASKKISNRKQSDLSETKKIVGPPPITEIGKDLIGYGSTNSQIQDNCKLSIDCAMKLLEMCDKLKRLGDLTWWSLATPHHLAQFCQYIKEINSSLVITFDDIILPDFEIHKYKR